MPWSSSDASRHSKKASPKKWATIANAVLKETGDDVKAIKIANAKAKRTPSKGTKK